MIPVVSFIGLSNSGKTTLLEKVIKELKIRGYRVAVVKHCPHGFDIDHPGKDSWRLAQAGSDVVAVSSPNKTAFVERLDTELTLAQIRTIFEAKADIVLAEGYKKDNADKILVLTTYRRFTHCADRQESPWYYCRDYQYGRFDPGIRLIPI